MKLKYNLIMALSLLFAACNPDSLSQLASQPKPFRSSAAPEWAKNANIYEVNIRQYTPEGTFQAFAQHLPRLKDMGVKILWLMPIHPISTTKRQGTLGSYYAISDYQAVNPEFGTMQDFKALVAQIHALDMKIILDWVPNHTGWDHAWLTENQSFYTTDINGAIIDPVNFKTGKSFGWTDVASLNYSNLQLREAMVEDMLFWLQKGNIDGFRCDMAAQVPDEFWLEAIPRLRQEKPDIFLLAEAEHPPHRNLELFTASYSWSFHRLLNDIAKGKKHAAAIEKWYKEDIATYIGGYHMHFITNHDENSWNGSEYERMGDAVEAMAVLVHTFEGIPLMYSGQEAAFTKRLSFFDKDQIEWSDFAKQDFYKTLLQLKAKNKALWNGIDGGSVQPILSDNSNVFAFLRQNGADKVLVVLNLSDKLQFVTLQQEAMPGNYVNVFDKSITALPSSVKLELKPWSYLVWTNY